MLTRSSTEIGDDGTEQPGSREAAAFEERQADRRCHHTADPVKPTRCRTGAEIRLPLFSLARTVPEMGGLMLYAADQAELLSSISTDLSLWRAILGPAYGARFRQYFMTEQY